MRLIKALFIMAALGVASACASKPKYDSAMMDKYPQCYSNNVKIFNKCVKLNEAGNATTALQIENAAHPGQYK